MSKETEASDKTSTKTATTTSTSAQQTKGDVSREQVVEDLKKTISDARAYLEKLGDDGKGMARQKAEQTQGYMEDWRGQCEDTIRRKPITSVAIALGLGYIIGKLGD